MKPCAPCSLRHALGSMRFVPMFPGMSESDVNRLINAVKEAIWHAVESLKWKFILIFVFIR